jgi:hypothetical protein
MKSDLAWRARVQERHMTEPAFASDQERRLVRKERFELSRSCERQPLKLVRLPVPPLSRGIRLRGLAPLRRDRLRSDSRAEPGRAARRPQTEAIL